jgi:hypothetical protein
VQGQHDSFYCYPPIFELATVEEFPPQNPSWFLVLPASTTVHYTVTCLDYLNSICDLHEL